MGGFETSDDWNDGIMLHDLSTPCLLIDLEILERNLRRMALRMRKHRVAMRPHFKTHRSLEIVEIQTELKAVGFTVSTLEEAEVLWEKGYFDITWAFPVPPYPIERLADALAFSGPLRLVVDSSLAVDQLEQYCRRREMKGHVWLKVDCGYHRAGVDPEGPLLLELGQRLFESDVLVFDGILSHSGHAYDCRGKEALARVAEEERRVMVEAAERLRAHGVKVPGVSIGSTPAMSAIEDLTGITEVRPGNYVFYDYSQVLIGSCGLEDCALTVLSSVVSCQPGASHSVIDAGALSLSKDLGPADMDPQSYGRIFSDYEAKELSERRIVSLSQEHGIVDGPLEVGTRLRILPNHSCLAMPNFSSYYVMRGDRLVDRGDIAVTARA